MHEYPINPTRKAYKQLCGDNPKLAKSEKLFGNIVSTAWHGAPGSLSGYEMCPFADYCRKPCLHTAGNPTFMADKTTGRIRKTRMLVENKAQWQEEFLTDLCIQQKGADEKGFLAVHRPNATTDRRWETVRFRNHGKKTMFELLPRMQFMDYTKYPFYLRPDDRLPKNYHLTFSLSGSPTNEEWAQESLDQGRNVTVVFAVRRLQPLPKVFWGLPVIDGDEHDLRYMDPPGHIVGLRAKGQAIGDTSGFVRDPLTQERIKQRQGWLDADPHYATYKVVKQRS
jgi:hypothetical protein